MAKYFRQILTGSAGRRSGVSFTVAVLAVWLGMAWPAGAAFKFWSGLGANSTWTNAANWGGAIPNAGDDLVFQAGAARLVNTNSFAAGTVFNSITFLGTNYVIHGNALTLSGAAGLSAQHTTGTNIFNPALTLGTALTVECTGAGATFLLGTNCSLVLNGQNVTLNSVGTMRVSGAISGAGQVEKNGAGKLTIDGPASNTYLGATFVNAGTVELFKVGFPLAATAIPGDLIVGNGVATTTVRNLTVLEIADTANVTINQSGTWDLNGSSENIAGLTMTGGTVNTGFGTLTLGGDIVTFPSSSNAVINGSLSLGGVPRTFYVSFGSAPVDLVINATISDGGASAGFASTGPGFLALSGTNTYTGLTKLQGGYTFLNANFALGASGSGTNGTIVGANAYLQASGRIITNEFLTLSNNAFFQSGSDGAWSGPITLEGNAVQNIFAGGYTNSGPISGSGTLTKIGSGTLIFSGASANTYTNTTFVNAGTLMLAKSAFDGAIAGPLVIGDGSGGANADVVRLNSVSQIANLSRVTINSSGLLDLNNSLERIGSLTGQGNITLGLATLLVGDDGTTATFDGVISGLGPFTKVGPGPQSLNGANTYKGVTTVSAGTLLVNGAQPQSPVSVTGGVLGGGGVVGNITGTSGTISPGSSPGVLTSSNLVSSASTAYKFELRGPNPGTDYDQLNVRGTVNLTNASLQLSVAFTNGPVSLGHQLVLIQNDGFEPVAGSFAGFPNGANFASGGYNLLINYAGGDGNDVVLTVTSVPGAVAGATVVSGNGDGAIDPNECNLLYLAVTNTSAAPLTGVSASLATTTPGVVITHPQSAYANLPANGKGTNLIPFQITTLPLFNCGDPIDLVLTVTTAGGNFTVSNRVFSGATGAPLRFNNNTLTPIPDLSTVNSTVSVSGLTTAIKKVSVSLYLVHTYAADLTLTLLAPDGTPVELSSNNGSSGDNYGSDCADVNRTIFDDAAPLSIVSVSAPFIGAFRPEGTLATFTGQAPAAANGLWTLRITDGASGDFGTLVCWSLSISPTLCASGGGGCDLCPNITLAAALGASSAVQPERLSRNGQATSCEVPTFCPGAVGGDGGLYFNAHTFRNGPSNACITVTLTAPTTDLFSAAYLDLFEPSNICSNYLADSGDSTVGLTFPAGPRIYSFNVPGSAVFTVTVNGVYGSQGPYQLSVTGGDCRPSLNIRPAPPGQVRLDWPTSAGGYLLQSTPAVAPTNWTTMTNVPFISGGRYAVTNSPASRNEFYRLLKP